MCNECIVNACLKHLVVRWCLLLECATLTNSLWLRMQPCSPPLQCATCQVHAEKRLLESWPCSTSTASFVATFSRDGVCAVMSWHDHVLLCCTGVVVPLAGISSICCLLLCIASQCGAANNLLGACLAAMVVVALSAIIHHPSLANSPLTKVATLFVGSDGTDSMLGYGCSCTAVAVHAHAASPPQSVSTTPHHQLARPGPNPHIAAMCRWALAYCVRPFMTRLTCTFRVQISATLQSL